MANGGMPERVGTSLDALHVGLAKARSDFRMLALGGGAWWGAWCGPPRRGGAYPYVISGMARQATQEPGGLKSMDVAERVYSWARSVEVAAVRAASRLGVEEFPKKLGLPPGRFHRFSSEMGTLNPEVATPLSANFLSRKGRRVTALALPEEQKIGCAKVWAPQQGSLEKSTQHRCGNCGSGVWA